MRKVYAARSVAKKHIIEQCENCNLKKNSNGLYNPNDIVKVQETIEGKLNEVFLDHDLGLGMIKLLDSTNNEINSVTTNQMISADNVIQQAKKDALAATAAAKKKDKSAKEVEPTITKKGRSQARSQKAKHHQPNHRRHKGRSHRHPQTPGRRRCPRYRDQNS